LNSELEGKDEDIKNEKNIIDDLHNLLQQEKDKYKSKVQVYEDGNKTYEKQLSERKDEIQDLKHKIEKTHETHKWKKNKR